MPNMDERGGQDQLGQRVRSRRLELGLSARAAAQAAGIDRNTWSYLENGTRRTAEFNYAGVERALRWAPGSISAILGGGEPTVLPSDIPPAEDDDEEIALVRTDPRLTDDMRQRIILLIRERRERDKAAALEDTRRMIDLFRRG
ncbi:helix-turn-helix domain-containing protein [Micromonospora sp. S-DT3-3-22]|uniref:helix-turn-helix domain-containing protein n=1 Tax=Micromonospora sp. S-DT3-3-22 TaxID=2755359 RepID=UPI00188FC6C0|nr:helix-turn-helix domain-containing protein [Micromonospora sp. S-DT3-3-22]